MYYIEILENGEIVSFGESTSVDLALKNTKNILLEITEREYKLISACRGNPRRGISVLHGIEDKITNYLEYLNSVKA
jgi:hypothetical protein